MARTGIKIPKPPGGSLDDIIREALAAYKAVDGKAVPAVVNAVDKPALTAQTKFGSALISTVKSAEAKVEARQLAKLERSRANAAANKLRQSNDQRALNNMTDEQYDAAMAAKEAKKQVKSDKQKNINREEIDKIWTPQTQKEKGIPALGEDLDRNFVRIEGAARVSDETSDSFEKELLRVYEYRLADATRRAGKELTKKQKAQIAKDASYDILTGSDRDLSVAERQMINRIQGGVTQKGKVVVGEAQKSERDLIRDAAVIARRDERQQARRYRDRMLSAKKNVKELEDDEFGAAKRYQRGYRDVEYDNMLNDAYQHGASTVTRTKGMTAQEFKAARIKAGIAAEKAWAKIMKEDMGWTRVGDGFKKPQNPSKPGKSAVKPKDMTEEDWASLLAKKKSAEDEKAIYAAIDARRGDESKYQNVLETVEKKPANMSEAQWVQVQEEARMKKLQKDIAAQKKTRAKLLAIRDKQKNKLVRENTMKMYSKEDLAKMKNRAADARDKRVGQDIEWLNKNGFDTKGLSDDAIIALRSKVEYAVSTSNSASKALDAQKTAREKLDAQLKRGVLTRKEYEDLVGQLPRKVTSSGATKIPKATVKKAVKPKGKVSITSRAKVKISERDLAEITEALRGEGTPFADGSMVNRVKRRIDY